MNDSNLLQALGQVSSDEAGQIFRDHLRGFVREMISDVMASEVNELCGPKHQPSSSQYVRSGSSSGRVLVDGERESVVRPRVRKYGEDVIRHNSIGQTVDPKHRRQEFLPSTDPLTTMLKRLARQRIIPTQECPSHAALNTMHNLNFTRVNVFTTS